MSLLSLGVPYPSDLSTYMCTHSCYRRFWSHPSQSKVWPAVSSNHQFNHCSRKCLYRFEWLSLFAEWPSRIGTVTSNIWCCSLLHRSTRHCKHFSYESQCTYRIVAPPTNKICFRKGNLRVWKALFHIQWAHSIS